MATVARLVRRNCRSEVAAGLIAASVGHVVERYEENKDSTLSSYKSTPEGDEQAERDNLIQFLVERKQREPEREREAIAGVKSGPVAWMVALSVVLVLGAGLGRSRKSEIQCSQPSDSRADVERVRRVQAINSKPLTFQEAFEAERADRLLDFDSLYIDGKIDEHTHRVLCEGLGDEFIDYPPKPIGTY